MPNPCSLMLSVMLSGAIGGLAAAEEPRPEGPRPGGPDRPAGGRMSGPSGGDRQREIDEIRQKLAELQSKRNDLREEKRMGPDAPEFRELTEHMDRLERELMALKGGQPRPSAFGPSPKAGTTWERPVPPPLVEDVLERLRRERPELHERLMILRRENPEQFEKELPRFALPFPNAFGQQPTPPPPTVPGSAQSPSAAPVMPPPAVRMPLNAPGRKRLELEELRRHDPERARLMERDEQLTDRIVELAERCRRDTDPTTHKETESQLRETLSQQFDIRMQIRQLEIKEIKQRLDELMSGLDKRMKDKANLIERRMQQLLSPDETEW